MYDVNKFQFHFILPSQYLYLLQVGYIPIPRVEYSDDELDFVIENLTLPCRSLLPYVVALETKQSIKFSPYRVTKGQHQHHHIKLTLERMQADMCDIAFHFHKKTGIAKLTDSGIMDVHLGEAGLSVCCVPVKFDTEGLSFFSSFFIGNY